jgi:hypothetical protein
MFFKNLFKNSIPKKGEVAMKKKEIVSTGIGVVLLLLFLVIGSVYLQKIFAENGYISKAKGIEIANSMGQVGELPWAVDEYDLVAVLFCESPDDSNQDGKTFVHKKSVFHESGGWMTGCQYMAAKNLTIIPEGNIWTNQTKIKFE